MEFFAPMAVVIGFIVSFGGALAFTYDFFPKNRPVGVWRIVIPGLCFVLGVPLAMIFAFSNS